VLKMGFVLLTHQNGPHLERLVTRVNELYDEPLIVCHHDTARSPTPRLPGNVTFVPAIRTRWGAWSLVEASLRSLRTISSHPGSPDWVTLLSGADYPIASAASVFSALESEPADVHTYSRHIELGDPDPWVQDRARRYFGWRWSIGPVVPNRKAVRSVGPSGPLATKVMSPFGHGLECYSGSQWWTMNRRATNAVLGSRLTMPQLARRYRHVFCPDESYVQTVLGNTDGIVVCSNPHRYMDRSTGRLNQSLGLAQVPAMMESEGWFARKFALNGSDPVCDAIDELVS
jgi:hypothetical protein